MSGIGERRGEGGTGSGVIGSGETGPGGIRTVLVHGAWHDGSCWAPVAERLAERGHDVRVVDLPSEQPEAAVREYAGAVLRAVQPLGPDDRVVLVGHSLGGLTVPVVAQTLGPSRVAAIVLVAALVPRPGGSWQQRARAAMVAGFGRGQVRHDDGTTSWPAEAAPTGLYAGVADELAAAGSPTAALEAAVAGLRRQGWAITREITPLQAWPAVPTVRVICAADRVVDAGWSRSEAGTVPGAEVVELAGGHFPMLTCPDELVAVIEKVLERAADAADRPAGGEQ